MLALHSNKLIQAVDSSSFSQKMLPGSADSITSSQKANTKKKPQTNPTALRICLDKIQVGKIGKTALLAGYMRVLEASKPLVKRFVCRP